VNENLQIGGLFSQQKSKMVIGGTADVELGDWSVDNYHGVFTYNFGDFGLEGAAVLRAGLGATHYSGVDFAVGSQTRSIGGETSSRPRGAWGQDLPRQERGPEARRALDAHLHQVRRIGLVVRPLLGLLRDGRRTVLEPVRVTAA